MIQFRAVSKKPETNWWNFLWNFHGDKTVEFPVEFLQKVPQKQNRGTFCGNSTKTKPWKFLWNFHGEFLKDKTVEFSVEIPQNVPQRQIRGTFLWKFHRKFHKYKTAELSVEFPQNALFSARVMILGDT